MPAHEIHVCDADCLINLHRHFGRKAISALHRLGKTGGFKLPEGVVRELIHSTDKLARFVQEQRQQLEVAARQISALHTEIPRLERAYGEKIRVGTQEYAGFWSSHPKDWNVSARPSASKKARRITREGVSS